MPAIDKNTLNFSNSWKAACFVFLASLPLLPLFAHSLMNHAPEYDELLHIMAARGVNDGGNPTIADGTYPRASLYTRLIAAINSDSAPGNELVRSRLPALIFGILLTGIVGAWVTRKAGWLAGLTAAAILAISPQTVHMSVIVRFYTIHTLLITVIFIVWYEAISVQKQFGKSLLYFATGIPLLFLALHFHDLTKIAFLAAVAGIFAVVAYDHRHRLLSFVQNHKAICMIALVTILVAVVWAWNYWNIEALLRGSVPLWSADKSGNYAFYLSAFASHLPLLWPLLPLMIIFGLIKNPRFTIYCTTVLAAALVVNSIAAQKATRYFYHTYPMICILWGIGFQQLVQYSSRELSKHWQISWKEAVGLVFLITACCAINAHEVKRAIKLAINRGQLDSTIPASFEPDWSLATQRLSPVIENTDTIIVTSGVSGLYFFGRYDYELSTTVVQETDTGMDFGLDLRSGRRVIGQPDSVKQVIDQAGTELFILENRMLNKHYSAPLKTVAVLKDHCEFIDLTDTGSELSAWLCQ